MQQRLPMMWQLAIGAVALFALVGCGSGVEMAKVAGKVTSNGQPVKDGDLTFVPISAPADKENPRRPGIGVIENGSFTASTESTGDGLAVGKYNVSFNARNPPWEAPENTGDGPPPMPPQSEYAGLVPQVTEVEIKSGSNDLTVELVPAGGSQ
jgi:hypothetical protein